ncbi:Putative glycosyltransferase EpsE [Vibrio thalassae]|uniref:Glycosyltransferase EpsE n=1 Tax=Vibrio thalassae TaxID=1243014 RepID=A0A240EIR5_9VIBR|nr:glycosyltransferase family 2 protein [Vibrio thalassae]SNX47855.1 Putative glycosyltransferase EpsE [Vibrio thalassae]
MSNSPYFSILLCVYNGCDYIESCLQSIIDQGFDDWELILVDDGSTDNLTEVLAKSCYQDSRIKYFYKSNSGLTDSLNFGLEKCTGEWIVRQDVDDISLPNRLMSIKNASLKYDCDIIYSQAEVYDFRRNQVKITPRKAFQYAFDLSTFKFGNYIAHGTIAVKSPSLKKIRYNTDYEVAQDFGLYVDLASIGLKGHMIVEPLYRLNKVPDSISAKKSQLQIDTVSSIIKKNFTNDNYFILKRKSLAKLVLLVQRELHLIRCRCKII